MYEQFELLSEYETTTMPEGVSRRSSQYIKWIQASLNQILGLQLKVDGVMGVKTRSAIRSFQKRNGLDDDGVVGPNTERVLKILVDSSASPDNPVIIVTPAAPCPTFPLKVTIGGYVTKQSSLSKAQFKQVSEIGRMITENSGLDPGCSPPITSIDIVGHTDNRGSRPYNLELGKKRAEAVAKILELYIFIVTMFQDDPIISTPKITITMTKNSAGFDQAIATNTTDAGRALNRRVEILINK